MTEENKPSPEVVSIETLKATYSHLKFIHDKFLTTPFYLEEHSAADASLKFVTELANKIAQQINELTPKEEVKAESEQANG